MAVEMLNKPITGNAVEDQDQSLIEPSFKLGRWDSITCQVVAPTPENQHIGPVLRFVDFSNSNGQGNVRG